MFDLIKSVEELDRIRDECKKLVTTRSAASAAAAAVPVPGADVAVDIGILMELIPSINRRFGLSHEQVEALDHQLKAKLVVIITSVGNDLIGSVVTKKAVMAILKKVGVRVAAKSVGKYLPIVGTALASSISFGAMKWMGNTHVDDCYEAARRMLTERTSNTSGADAAIIPA